MNEDVPDPDVLLAGIEPKQAKTKPGRLKIFFGAATGVGKTYAMLLAGQERRKATSDVVVGLVEAHGRSDIKVLLKGLEIIPTKPINCKGTIFPTFDLDAALKRAPSIILIDELAHSNPANCRHPKRWQDVYELLEAGIDVYTTLNVQHLESLKDEVGLISGVRVSETVPDTVFEEADEIELVDLSPEELILRFKAGKVYQSPQLQLSLQNFFRKGNLIALRELALRQTASHVASKMLDYREDNAIHDVWQVGEKILVCIGPNPLSERLVRAGKRLASGLRADWIVAYVETPELERLPVEKRDGVLRILRLAEQLGAKTITLSSPAMSEAIIQFACERNINKILLGKPSRRGWRRWLLGSVVDDLISDGQNINIYLLGSSCVNDHDELENLTGLGNKNRLPSWYQPVPLKTCKYLSGYAWALVITLVSTSIAHTMHGRLEQTNLVMVFLLGVVYVATRFGRGPSILASLLGVGVFDLMFVRPYYSFSVADSQYLVTLTAMLIISIIVSNLMANVRSQAKVAGHRERRASALYDISEDLAASQTEADVVRTAVKHIFTEFSSRNVILFPDHNGYLLYPKALVIPQSLQHADLKIAQWVFDHNDMAGQGTNTLSGSQFIYFPICNEDQVLAVLVLAPINLRRIFLPEQKRLLETFLRQIGQALARLRFAEQAKLSHLQVETERLRNSLLSAISHDLRTPLATIIGAASTLSEDDGYLRQIDKQELSRAIVDEAERMSSLVNNILDMAKLEAGQLELNRQWHPIEEIIGTVLTRMQKQLIGRRVKVKLPPGIPMVYVDAVMIEQVLINLLENAVRYTPADTDLEINADVSETTAKIIVIDHGSGIQAGQEERLFQKFYQVRQEAAQSGVGLGLAICRAIVEVHGGRIYANNHKGGGAVFTFVLPLEQSPPSLFLDE